MPTTDNGGVEIAYGVRGKRDAPTVVLCEGLGYGRWMWRWQTDALADDYRVITWDNRGTGASAVPDPPYSVAEMAGDLNAVLDATDTDAAHVVGASMGGMIALSHALDYDRAESLALLCTSPGGPKAVATPEETTTRMFGVPDDADEREAIRYKMAPAVTDGFIETNPDLVESIVDARLASDAPPRAREAQAGAVAAFDVSDRLGEIDVPTLVMHGTADQVLPVGNSEPLLAGIDGVESAIIDGGSHLFFIEESNRVNDRLTAFLADE
ncbi:3-oxoadipate enol-lactone hydrolase [Halobacteriales archaeon SW_6_65_46]|nr:MAG: 3-oxoadipate enol-lactone hydrolase [Halobacteriales archaeon SW_6_65_46]